MAETEKKTGGSRFQKGNPGGPGRGKKKPKPGFGFDPVADLLHVYRNSSDKDVTEGHKGARKLLVENYQKFMEMLLKADGITLAPAGDGVAAAATETGPKEERIEELAERLLRDWELQSNTTGG